VTGAHTYQARGAKDGVRRDLPTGRLTERLGDLRERVLAAGADTATGEAKEAAAGTATKVFQATSVVREKIGSLAEVIREKAPQEGTVRTVATAVANKLDAAGSYLQEKDLGHLGGDLSRLICRYPLPALLIGLGIGHLWGRSSGGQAR
jgi:hypothetical protein